MPSRRVFVLVLLFWVLTTAYVTYRDVWPRLFAAGPPAVAIDLADEAAQMVYVRWTIYRGEDQKIGKLTTYMSHVDADDTFWFTTEYREVKLDVMSVVRCDIPELTAGVRVTRGGDLREQKLEGKLTAYIMGKHFADADAKVHGKVIDGRLAATCTIKSPLCDITRELDPVEVPEGQPLNPLLPVNRLQNIRPGHSWHVQMVNPLEDVGRKLLEEAGLPVPVGKQEPLFAQVLPEPQTLSWNNQSVMCWVIEYRRDEVVARTWVRASDGRVLKQQALHGGEQLTIVRE